MFRSSASENGKIPLQTSPYAKCDLCNMPQPIKPKTMHLSNYFGPRGCNIFKRSWPLLILTFALSFSLRPLLFTHFGGFQKADFYWQPNFSLEVSLVHHSSTLVPGVFFLLFYIDLIKLFI